MKKILIIALFLSTFIGATTLNIKPAQAGCCSFMGCSFTC